MSMNEEDKRQLVESIKKNAGAILEIEKAKRLLEKQEEASYNKLVEKMKPYAEAFVPNIREAYLDALTQQGGANAHDIYWNGAKVLYAYIFSNDLPSRHETLKYPVYFDEKVNVDMDNKKLRGYGG